MTPALDEATRVDFGERVLPVVNKRVHPLGLSFNRGISAEGIQFALDHGINYLFWNRLRRGEQLEVIKAALARDRERYVLASGGVLTYFGCSVRRSAEKILRVFDIDYIDVFQLFWLGRMSAWTPAVQRELLRLKEEGLVRAIGVSIHDRKRAARLAEDSPVDLLMIRYNAAHPGAEADIFPSYSVRRPATVAYTATSWRKLLARPSGWDGPVMTPEQCYRFCLSNPNIDVVLCGAESLAQVDENLRALAKGPLTAEEQAWIRPFGRAVHGTA
ncbi:MAG: aldo/keto reductase [Myxococcales bacterium]|nr:aldo/keto reductase [Myxococcales bacterium]